MNLKESSYFNRTHILNACLKLAGGIADNGSTNSRKNYISYLMDEYIDFIKKTIRQYLQEGKIYLFGSRTKGTSRKYSDIDIALDCPNLNENILLKIKNDFENSTLPYEVDVLDLNNISETFKQHIKQDLTEI